MTYTLKIATASELPIIQEIAKNTWPTAYREIISAEQIAYMLEKMYNIPLLEKEQLEGRVHSIAYDDHQVPCGFSSYGPIENGEYKLHKLYILPAYQGKGVGKFLLSNVEKKLQEKGIAELHLQVNKLNPAVSFYKNNGFTILKETILEIGDGFIMDDYIMKKNIPPY